jgi:MFS family permease
MSSFSVSAAIDETPTFQRHPRGLQQLRGLGVLILGNSILEGVGTALLIPPVYILTTLLFTELTSRARAFGVISALGGIGAATGR